MRKTIALIIATLLIDIAVISSYVMPVEASAPALPFDGLYNSFSQIFGNAWGYFKSTDEMTYNMTMDKIQQIYESLSKDVPEIIEGSGIPFNILSYEEMMQGMQSSYEDVVNYNNGTSANDFYDKLNEQSYQSSGTLASKTLEVSLKKSLDFLSALTPAQYRTGMDMMFNSLFDEEGALAVDDMKQNFMFYESFMNTMIAGQQVGAINEAWFTPVENSVFDINDLSKGYFTYEGNVYPIYQIDRIEYYTDDLSMKYVFDAGSKVFVCPYYSEYNAQYILMFVSDKPFSVRFEQYASGNYIFGDTYSASSYGNIAYKNSIGFANSKYFPYSCGVLPSSIQNWQFEDAFVNYYSNSLVGVDLMAQNGQSVSAKAPGLSLALDSFWNKDLTAEDVVNLADDLAQVGTVAGTDTGIATLTDVVSGLTITLPDSITDAKNDVVTAVEGVGEKILTLPKAIWLEFADVLEGIKAKAEAIDTTKPWDGEHKNNSVDFVTLINGILILLLIIFVLLKIFIHCMMFIINIFKIQAYPAFLPDEVIMGLDYLNTLEIPGIGLSVYSFMMGLVYIMIVFFAIRILRINVDRIKLPKKR